MGDIIVKDAFLKRKKNEKKGGKKISVYGIHPYCLPNPRQTQQEFEDAHMVLYSYFVPTTTL